MTFNRKNRLARQLQRPTHRATRRTDRVLAPLTGEHETSDAMRSVVAHTTTGWNSLRHAV
jgi:hypothetical protein